MRHCLKNPRYKICFQTKNKVWIYKNSRLRNFYQIRSKIVLKSGRVAKNFLITKNMKWTVARRQMVPYFRNKNRFRYFYKNLFFTKQQLKNFYGGLKEYQIRNIFKKTWNKEHYYRTNIFISSLEQRLGVILFRMRLLPTIFACNQLVKHQGILVNDFPITLVNYRVKLGDIVSISQDQWFIFYQFLFDRLQNRFFGQGLLLWRKSFVLCKLQYARLKKKKIYIANLRLYDKFKVQKNRYKAFKNFLIKYLKVLKKNPSDSFKPFKLNVLKILNFFLYRKVFCKLKRLHKFLNRLRKWSRDNYFLMVNWILFNIYNIKLLLNFFFIRCIKMFFAWTLCDLFAKFGESTISAYTQKEFLLKLLNNFNKINSHRNELFKQRRILSIIKTRKYKEFGVKRSFVFKNKVYKYKRYFLNVVRKLKYRKIKKKTFKHWCRVSHWYTPKYLEVDYNTLRASFIYYPESSEVHYGFLCSFKKIISFYKERAL